MKENYQKKSLKKEIYKERKPKRKVNKRKTMPKHLDNW